jgi:uncharacterized protein involved in exopolysaccharide biosynthesis
MTANPPPENPLSAPPASTPPPPESADLFDYGLIRDYLGYFAGSVRRHPLFCGTVYLTVVGLAAFLLWALPKTYHVETKLLAQRNQVIAMLGNPGRSMPWESDMPTRAATETILRHDNLVSLVMQTNLVSQWPKTRAPLMKVKDGLMTILRRGQPIPDDDMVAVLVGTLETRLSVATTEGTVKIAIDWPDARTAFQLVDAAQRNFLEARHLSEVSTISEAISILESRATTLRDEIEVDLEKVEAARKDLERRRPKAPTPVAAPVRTVKREDDSFVEMREQVETKRRAIADLEDFHKRQLKQLQTRLAEAKAVYSDAHPLVLDLKQQIDTLQGQQESLQLSTLREELRTLEKEALRKGAITSTETGDTVRNARRLPVAPQQLARATSAEIEEAPIEQAKGDLRYALSKYNSILDRIDSARMEMETARAAFKYRYSVISPAEIPRDPVKPKVAPVMAVSAVAGLLLAIFLAGALDLRRGMVHESWQLVRHLDLPVVGEVRRA